MGTRTARWLLLGMLGLPALWSCAGPSGTIAGQTAEADAGKIGLELDLAGLHVERVSYVITGPGGFAKSANIDVSGASKVTALIGGLPAGRGFSIVLSTEVTEPAANCSGSAGFDVTAGATTAVTLSIECHLQSADCADSQQMNVNCNGTAGGGAGGGSGMAGAAQPAPVPSLFAWLLAALLAAAGTGAIASRGRAGLPGPRLRARP